MKIPMVAGKPFGALTVAKSLDGAAFNVIRPHPSVPDSKYGNIVARVNFSTIDGVATEETKAYAELFALAPKLLEALLDVLRANIANNVAEHGNPAYKAARLLLMKFNSSEA